MNRQRQYDQRRLDAGWKRIELWLGPEDQQCLARLKRADISAQEAIRRAIEECARRKA
jgi:hypothetical protein